MRNRSKEIRWFSDQECESSLGQKRGEDKGKEQHREALGSSTRWSGICMGKWNGDKFEDIFTLLKQQEWPKWLKHVVISVQTRSAFTSELCRSTLRLVAAAGRLTKRYSIVLPCRHYAAESYLSTGAALPHNHQLSTTYETEREN